MTSPDETQHGKPDAEADVISDPSESTEDQNADWADEGGATSRGPATEDEAG